MRRHDRHARRAAGRVARASGALHQARDALRRADLEHAIDRQEIDAEIEARRADDRLQLPVLQTQFDPLAHFLIERAVMQRDQPGPVRPQFQQRAIPDLRLRARVGEDERTARLLDFIGDRADLPHAEMAAPRKALDRVGDQRIDDRASSAARRARSRAASSRDASSASCASARLPSVADKPQTCNSGPPAREARERELRLRAALVAEQLVPFIDDDMPHVREFFLRVGARQHQREAFGRRDERRRHAAILPRAFGRWRVAGAQADRPRHGERGDGRLQRAGGVGGERAHRRDPEHGERRGQRARFRLRANAASAPSQTAHVLPAPVVAWSRPLDPCAISRHTSRWKSNGCQPLSSNQRAMRASIGVAAAVAS